MWKRALALFAAMGVGFGSPRDEVEAWLRENSLWDELTPREQPLFLTTVPTAQQSVNAGWKAEALIVLLWAIQLVPDLPQPNEQVNTAVFQELLPPFTEESTESLCTRVTRRSDRELTDMGQDLLGLHSWARHAANTGVSSEVDIEIIQERHHAINWVLGYARASWDNVSTDT